MPNVDIGRSSTVQYHSGTRLIFALAMHHRFPNPNHKSQQFDSGRRSGSLTGTHFAAISNHTGVERRGQPLHFEFVSEPTRTTSFGL